MSLMAEVGELFWQLFPFSQQLKLLGKQWAPPLDAFLSAPLQICIYVYVTLWPSNPITVITWAVFEASNSCGFVCFLLYFCFSQLSFSLGSFMGVRLMPEPKKKSQREYYQQQKLFFLPFLIFLFEIDLPCLMDFSCSHLSNQKLRSKEGWELIGRSVPGREKQVSEWHGRTLKRRPSIQS